MSKPIALPLLLAAIVAFYFAIQGLFHPGSQHSQYAYYLATPAIASAVLAFAILLNLFTFPRKKMHAVSIPDGSEFRLLPQQFRKERIRNTLIFLISLALPAVLLAFHLEFSATPALEAHFISIAAVILSLLLLLQLLHRTRSTRLHSDFRLLITPGEIHLNNPFHLRIDITAGKLLHLTELRARLLCFEHNLLHSGRYVQLSVRQRDEILLKLAEETILSPNQPLSKSTTITLDSTQVPPSGKWAITMYPFYHWELRVELLGNPTYFATYPLTVHRPLSTPSA